MNLDTTIKKEQGEINKRNILKTIYKISIVFLCAIYVCSIIYGIYCIIDPNYATGQAILIIQQSCGGIILCFAFPLVEKILKLRVSYSARLGIFAFAFMAIFMGETLRFYYTLTWWDDLLHFSSGIGITLLAYAIVSNIFAKKDFQHKWFAKITIAIMASFAIAFLWEICEFSVDSIAGTNMQKFMPETEELFNGGNSFEYLEADPTTIADFYQTPYGYRYALMDTMTDMLDCFVGSLLFTLCSFAIYRKDKDHSFENMIELKDDFFAPVKKEEALGK